MELRRLCALVLLAGAPVVGGCGGAKSRPARFQPQPAVGFENAALQSGSALASAYSTRTTRVDGISCDQTEHFGYYLHVHLVVYVDGVARSLPAGIGIPGSRVVQTPEGPLAAGGQCFYWLHTQAPDGIVDVQAPAPHQLTLGQFFDVWREPLSASQVASARGRVIAVVDGRRWSANPRAIPLLAHAVIQLDVGAPAVSFQTFSWAGTEL